MQPRQNWRCLILGYFWSRKESQLSNPVVSSGVSPTSTPHPSLLVPTVQLLCLHYRAVSSLVSPLTALPAHLLPKHKHDPVVSKLESFRQPSCTGDKLFFSMLARQFCPCPSPAVPCLGCLAVHYFLNVASMLFVYDLPLLCIPFLHFLPLEAYYKN